MENWENNGMEEIGLVTPTFGLQSTVDPYMCFHICGILEKYHVSIVLVFKALLHY